jgi:FkbM family methyltransferase
MLAPIGDMHSLATITRDELEKTCRHHTFSAYLGNHVLLCRILSRLKMYVDGRDTGIAPHLIMEGFWESWISQWMAKIIQPGFVCIDVGANLGYFSLLMSELCHGGESGIAVAVEPNPPICHLLGLSQSLHTRRFTVMNKAISSYTGEAVLTIPGMSFGGATIKTNDPAPDREQVRVSTITLDDLVAELKLPRVDVIKIDVEGEEPAVFEGMEKTLAYNPNMQIVMEYSPSIYYEKKESFTNYLLNRFNIHLVKDNATVERIEEGAVKNLMQINNHTDFYLTQKRK